MGASARHMSSLDAAKARLEKALARLTEEVTSSAERAAHGGASEGAVHVALDSDYEALRDERDGLAARLAEAEARLASLAHDTDELGRRLGSAIAKVERLMES